MLAMSNSETAGDGAHPPPGEKSLKDLIRDLLQEEPSLLAPVVESVVAKTGEKATTETAMPTSKLDFFGFSLLILSG